MKQAPTPTELTVMHMWADLLATAPETPSADFFELGGQSLALLRFMARVEEAYGVELPVELLFAEDLTVSLAARAIEETLLELTESDR